MSEISGHTMHSNTHTHHLEDVVIEKTPCSVKQKSVTHENTNGLPIEKKKRLTCSCSFARLMHHCSKLFTLKFSKPKMSKMPICWAGTEFLAVEHTQ